MACEWKRGVVTYTTGWIAYDKYRSGNQVVSSYRRKKDIRDEYRCNGALTKSVTVQRCTEYRTITVTDGEITPVIRYQATQCTKV